MSLEKSILDHRKVNEKFPLVIALLIVFMVLGSLALMGIRLDSQFLIFTVVLSLYVTFIHFLSRTTINYFSKRGSKTTLNKIKSLISDPSIHPIKVEVQPLTYWERAFYRYLNKNGIRKAVDSEGKSYPVIYSGKIKDSFEANLYETNGSVFSVLVFQQRYVIIPTIDENETLAKKAL